MWSNASVVLWNFFLSLVELNVVLTFVTCNSHLQHTSTELTNSHNRRNIFVAIEAVDVMACIWLEEDRRLKLTLHISSLSFSSDMIIVLIGTRQDALCHHVVSKIVLNFRRLPDHMTHDEKKMNLLSSVYVKILVDKASKIVSILQEVFVVGWSHGEFRNLKKILTLGQYEITFHKMINILSF